MAHPCHTEICHGARAVLGQPSAVHLALLMGLFGAALPRMQHRVPILALLSPPVLQAPLYATDIERCQQP